MIQRVYVDNFRCMVNCTVKLQTLSLLLGENGTGKTSLFDALRAVQSFLSGDGTVLGCFPPEELCRWEKERNAQRFEIEGIASGVPYKYELVIEFDEQRKKARVRQETLSSGARPLFTFTDGTVQLFRDDSSRGPSFPLDSVKSGLSTVSPRADNTMLTAFRQEMAGIVILKPCPLPVLMAEESRKEQDRLDEHGANFVSWYRYISQSEAGRQGELFEQLKQVLDGFDSLSFQGPADGTKRMTLRFRQPGADGKSLPYGFGELSDGQRMLVLLYTLLYATPRGGWSLFIDEPDNYLSLREVQPWLTTLFDLCGKDLEQGVVISHHPEVIDYLADRRGLFFSRDANGPVRVSETPHWAEGLTPAETVARGWVS